MMPQEAHRAAAPSPRRPPIRVQPTQIDCGRGLQRPEEMRTDAAGAPAILTQRLTERTVRYAIPTRAVGSAVAADKERWCENEYQGRQSICAEPLRRGFGRPFPSPWPAPSSSVPWGSWGAGAAAAPKPPGSAAVAAHGQSIVIAAKKKPRALLRYRATLDTRGRLVVELRSNANKVKVSYTSGKRKRSKTAKFRKGAVIVIVPAAATKVSARTKATRRLRASTRTVVRPTPVPLRPYCPHRRRPSNPLPRRQPRCGCCGFRCLLLGRPPRTPRPPLAGMRPCRRSTAA